MTANDKTSKRRYWSSLARSETFNFTVSGKPLNLTLYLRAVGYLEKQLQRAISLNPSLADDLNKDAPGAAKDDDKGIDDNSNQLAALI